jgi:hypothetical protein
MDKVKRILIIAGISILLIGLVGGSIAVFGTFSTGSRAGKIIKFSKKGLVFKTYEGELSLGAVSTDSEGALTEKWGFSVHRGDDSIIQAINTAMDEGYPVLVSYKEKYFQFDWRGDTKYFVHEVEKVEDAETRSRRSNGTE